MYSLTDYAYCCEFPDGAVILDLRADAYLAVSQDQLPQLRSNVCNWPARDAALPMLSSSDEVNVDALIALLVGRGVLAASAIPLRIELAPAAPPTSAISATTAFTQVLRLADIVRFLASLMTVIHLRRRGLVPVIEWLRLAQSALDHDCHTTWESTIALVRSFLRLRLYLYTAYRRCLFDSLVLSVYLTKANVPCTFVIGVSTKPFLAHAWVQVRETVLNDTAENVQLYKPIFSTGGQV